jgi:Ca2+/Na+ antiporter
MSNPICEIGEACAAGNFDGFYPGSTFFIDPIGMNALQLFWAFLAYGYVLFVSANMIGDGAELLLLIPDYKDLVASVVLPILGAVPDGMMVLFSGIGPLIEAQENVAVGVGSLAGSTIMLLTLPWVLSFYGGRVDFDANGSPDAAYDMKKSQRDTPAVGFLSKGIEFEAGAVANAKIMMLTCLAYFVIQIPAFQVDDQKSKAEYASDKQYLHAVVSESSGVHTAALAGLIVCVGLLCVYLAIQIMNARQPPSVETPVGGTQTEASVQGTSYFDFVKAAPVVRPAKDGWLVEKGMRMHITYLRAQFQADGAAVCSPFLASAQISDDVRNELKSLYKTKASKSKTSNGEISQDYMYYSLCDLGLNYKRADFDKMFVEADRNKSKSLDETEFVQFFSEFIICSKEKLPWEDDDGDDDDDDETPDEFKDLEPAAQRKAILAESLQQMIIGTVLVLIFSDPMVDVLGAIGTMTGVPAFYVAFVLAPLASNASELVASFKLASKKSKESITQSLQTLEGAAIMNNTYCLGIFYALIYVQGLAWKFTAETLSIVLVQLLVGALVVFGKKQQKMIYGLIVFSFYPLSLVFVAVLEANGID